MTAAGKHAVTPYDSPRAAMDALVQRIKPVESESVALVDAAGRVLAQPLVADRGSPACDVSAMDGYAVRLADLSTATLPVAGEAAIGQAPRVLQPGVAMRIFTGGPVPDGAQAVIRREDVTESPKAITLTDRARAVREGESIRRRGENLRAGDQVIPAGTLITGPVLAALATFGAARPTVYRRLKVHVIVTGDELLPPDAVPQPWQVRDSNTSAIVGGLAGLAWLTVAMTRHVHDDLNAIHAAVAQATGESDAVILTGGVSMGDHDHVPDAVRRAGGDVVFHRLPIRPGKPVLAAIGPRDQLIFGLPGNPVSVQTTLRCFALPALAAMAGLARRDWATAAVRLANPDDKRLGLTWYRPIRMVQPGVAELVDTRGSGDVAGAARSDGVIEVPPDTTGDGPFAYYAWDL